VQHDSDLLGLLADVGDTHAFRGDLTRKQGRSRPEGHRAHTEDDALEEAARSARARVQRRVLPSLAN
jgi:hypothetical protein